MTIVLSDGLLDLDLDRNYAPEPDGGAHYHFHSPDNLYCYGDSADVDYVDRYYRGRDDRVVVQLPYCIYPCHLSLAARRDRNIELLGEGCS